jgi:hypothetical protein
MGLSAPLACMLMLCRHTLPASQATLNAIIILYAHKDFKPRVLAILIDFWCAP